MYFSVFIVNEENNSQYTSEKPIVKDQQKFLCPADKEQKIHLLTLKWSWRPTSSLCSFVTTWEHHKKETVKEEIFVMQQLQ